MFKRCLIFVLLLAGVGCAWGQEDWEKWAWVSSEKPCLDYETHCWTWTGGRSVYLWGAVYVVRPGEKADFRVRIVKSRDEWADLNTAVTNSVPTWREQWRFVSSRKDANFSIRFVDSGESFSVRFISMSEWERRNSDRTGAWAIDSLDK